MRIFSKKMLTSIFILTAIFCFIQKETYGQLQEVIIKGEETTGTHEPIEIAIDYSKSYVLYNKSDIGTSGFITTIALKVEDVYFEYDNVAMPDLSRLKLYMLNTKGYNDLDEYPAEWNIDEFTKVFEGRVDFELVEGWLHIDLETPFYYEGNSLILGFDYIKNYNFYEYFDVIWECTYQEGISQMMISSSDSEEGAFYIIEEVVPVIKLVFDGFYPNVGLDIKTNYTSVTLGEEGNVIQGYREDCSFVWLSSNDKEEGFPNNERLNPIVSPDEITTYTLILSNESGFTSQREVVVEPKIDEFYGYEDVKCIVQGHGYFFGSNGGFKGYNYNEDYITTFYPYNAMYSLEFVFQAFDIIEGDYLEVYNGEIVDKDNLIGVFDNGKPMLESLTSDLGGAITFVFHSDEISNGNGWVGEISLINALDDFYASISSATLSIGAGSCDDRTITLGFANDVLLNENISFNGWYESVNNIDYTFLEGSQTESFAYTLTGISQAKYYKAKFTITEQDYTDEVFSNVITYSDICQTVSTTIMLNKDAAIFSLPSLLDRNLGNYILLKSSKWTSGGVPYALRGLLEFDLSSIPEGSIIQSANLTLFGQSHQQDLSYARSNESYLKKIIEPWQEYAVTWNNHPSSSTVDQVTIPETGVGTDENRVVDIKNFVQSWVNGEDNNGMELRLVTEVHYAAMTFASSDNSDSSLHPKLDVSYISLPSLIINTTNLQLSDVNGNELKYSISGAELSSNNINVGSTIRYNPLVPAAGSTSEVLVTFKFDSSTESTTVKIIIDSDSHINSVKVSDGSALSSSYYRLENNNNTIVFLDGTSLYEEENILPVYVELKDGILMDLDDSEYNKFHVIGADACITFSLDIFDKLGVKVFTTTDKLEEWNGKTTVFNDSDEDPALYVFPGSYSYEMLIDGILVKGKFLIDYTIQ